jgi:RHS repeat-associated protein
MTNDGFHTYTYDAEGNILQVDGGSTASYTYDAWNHRVRSQTGSTTYEYMYDYAGRRTSSWYNPSSGNPGTGNAGRIYWDNQEFAYRAANGQTYFDQHDFTGTIRMRTTYSGTVDTTQTSLPFGDAWTLYPQSSNSNESYFDFATLDHDGESNTDHAQFRNYSPTQGRWLAPDPYDGSYDLTNPQSLNRYAYVLNNPLSFRDPLGLEDDECGDDDSCDDGGGGGSGGGGGGSGGAGGGGYSDGGSPPDTPPSGYSPTGVNTSDGNPIYTDANGNIWIGSAGSPGTDNSGNGGFLPLSPLFPGMAFAGPPWLPQNRFQQGRQPGPPTKPSFPRPTPGPEPPLGPTNEPPPTNSGRFWYILMQLLRGIDNNINPPVVPIIIVNPCVVSPMQPYCYSPYNGPA